MKGKGNSKAAKDTFRQFAWNLAGTLATSKGGGKGDGKPGEKRP